MSLIPGDIGDEYEKDEQLDSHPVPDYDEDAEYERQQRLCAACHEREKDYSENSQSILCYECRQKFMMLHIPVKIRFFLAAVCAIFILSVIMLPPIISNYQIYLNAERNMKAREFCFAYSNYSAVLEKYNESVPVILKTADAAMSAQYFGDLAQTIDTYLAGKNLNDSEYAKAMEYSNLLDIYFVTLQEINDIGTEIGDDPTSENQAEIARVFNDKLEALLTKDNIDKTLVYFYLGNTSPNIETAIKYLKLAAEQDSRFTYPYSYYGNVLRRAGKLDEAKRVYQSALELNACDALSLRGLSILQLLDGQKSLALESIRLAYEIDPYGLYIPEALVITLCENGLRDEAMELLNQFIKDGFQVGTDLQEYLDGNLSIDQYYMS